MVIAFPIFSGTSAFSSEISWQIVEIDCLIGKRRNDGLTISLLEPAYLGRQ